MRKSRYTDEERVYALDVVAKLGGSYEGAAQYLKEEGKIAVTGKTLRNWSNDVSLERVEPTQDVLVLAAELSCLPETGTAEIRSEATKGLGAVVSRLNERLLEDRYAKRLNSYELVNIGNFFASLSGLNKDEQTNGEGTTNIYQQIINQTYHAKGD